MNDVQTLQNRIAQRVTIITDTTLPFEVRHRALERYLELEAIGDGGAA